MILDETVAETLALAELLGPWHQAVAVDRLAFAELAGVSPLRWDTTGYAEHWPRWIVASVLLHFDARRRGLTMFAEGEDAGVREKAPEWIEVRVDGPYIQQPSRGWYRLEVEINVFVATMKDDRDLYRHYRNVGTVSQAFLGPIPVWKLGGGVDDDGTPLGCLVATQSLDQRESLRVTHFGQLDAGTPVLRSSVEGHYYMQIHS